MVKSVPADRSFDAYQEFLLTAKLTWTRELYPLLKSEYARRLEEEKAAGRPLPKTAEDVQALIGDDAFSRYFGWFERHLQRMKYSGRHGLVPHLSRSRDELLAELGDGTAEGLLVLDPDFRQPDYYVAVDIHQHPGGVWSDGIAGYVYEKGARTTTPLVQRDADLHYRFTDQVMRRAGKPKRILDMGCGFGKSTRPFYTENRDADVVGVDLAAPCLRLAARTATEDQARNVVFRQADAAETGLPEDSFDVVTSTMVLHEMPPKHIEKLVGEAYRVLAPGGISIHLDFLTSEDPFGRFIHYGHSRRNNEPFMPPLNEMDLEGAHRRAGFSSYEVVPFEEMPGTLAPDFPYWRFPWVMIIARK